MQNIVDHLVSIFGSQAAVAKAAKCKQPSVWEWKARNVVPARRMHNLLRAAEEQGLPLTADIFFQSTPKPSPRKRRAKKRALPQQLPRDLKPSRARSKTLSKSLASSEAAR